MSAAPAVSGSVSRTAWLLPDDGIVDPVAVDLAATGNRAVRLTAAERREAAAIILAGGGSAWCIAERLKMDLAAARSLAASVITEAAVPEVPPAGREETTR